MVNIQNFLKSMQMLFSVEYIIPLLIIDFVSIWLFPGLWVISVYYCIVDPILHLYHTSSLWCISFVLFPPLSLSARPTDVPCPWQGFVSFQVFSSYPPFFIRLIFVCILPPLLIKHDIFSLKTHTISFSFFPITSLFDPSLKIAPEISEPPASQTSKPTTRGFGV